jgi:hypothetical protein
MMAVQTALHSAPARSSPRTYSSRALLEQVQADPGLGLRLRLLGRLRLHQLQGGAQQPRQQAAAGRLLLRGGLGLALLLPRLRGPGELHRVESEPRLR